MLPHYLFYVRVYAREKTYFSHEIALIFHRFLSIPEGEILPQKRVNNAAESTTILCPGNKDYTVSKYLPILSQKQSPGHFFQLSETVILMVRNREYPHVLSSSK